MRWDRGRRTGALVTATLALLTACAPAVTDTRPTGGAAVTSGPAITANLVTAAFSDRGAVWVQDGAVFLARAPGFRPERVPVPGRAVDVAWNGGEAWAALPASGWVQRLTGEPRVVQAGRVVAITDTRIYREDGSAVGYDGQPAPGLIGRPDDVVTGGDGGDYATQSGRLYRLDPSRTLLQDRLGAGRLFATPGGATVTTTPTVFTRDGSFRLLDGRLERVDAAGRVRASVPHEFATVGVVAEFVVTVSSAGAVRVFRYDLSEVKS